VAGNFDNNTSTRDAFKLDGALFLGNHDVKLGVDYERNATFAHAYYSGGQYINRLSCPTSGSRLCPAGQTSYYQHVFWTSSESDPVGEILVHGPSYEPRTYRLGVFVQDAFRVTPRLTLNLGLRYDADDVRNQFDNTVMKLSGEWQPRVGLAWDVLGD